MCVSPTMLSTTSRQQRRKKPGHARLEEEEEEEWAPMGDPVARGRSVHNYKERHRVASSDRHMEEGPRCRNCVYACGVLKGCVVVPACCFLLIVLTAATSLWTALGAPSQVPQTPPLQMPLCMLSPLCTGAPHPALACVRQKPGISAESHLGEQLREQHLHQLGGKLHREDTSPAALPLPLPLPLPLVPPPPLSPPLPYSALSRPPSAPPWPFALSPQPSLPLQPPIRPPPASPLPSPQPAPPPPLPSSPAPPLLPIPSSPPPPSLRLCSARTLCHRLVAPHELYTDNGDLTLEECASTCASLAGAHHELFGWSPVLGGHGGNGIYGSAKCRCCTTSLPADGLKPHAEFNLYAMHGDCPPPAPPVPQASPALPPSEEVCLAQHCTDVSNDCCAPTHEEATCAPGYTPKRVVGPCANARMIDPGQFVCCAPTQPSGHHLARLLRAFAVDGLLVHSVLPGGAWMDALDAANSQDELQLAEADCGKHCVALSFLQAQLPVHTFCPGYAAPARLKAV